MLAALSNDEGDYLRARALNERALAIRQARFGPEHVSVAQSLNDLAATLFLLGDPACQPLYERALVVREKALGPGSPEVAGAHYNLGLVERSTGNAAAAARHFERARSICEESGGCAGLLGQILLERGWLAHVEGDSAAARRSIESAIRTQESTFGPDHLEVARSLSRLAVVDLAAGRQAAARSDRERALRITEAQLDAEHPDRALRLAELADSLALAGETGPALDRALEAERIGRDHQRLVTRALGERGALRYGTVRAVALDLVISLALDASATVPAAWDSVMRSRGVVLDEMIRLRRAVARSTDAATAELVRREADARRRLAYLLLHAPSPADGPARARVLEQARLDLDSAERSLAAHSVAERPDLGEAGLEEVARAMPDDAALVAFVRFDRTTRVEPDTPVAHPPAWYAAFVRPAGDTRVRLELLGRADEIESLVKEWRRAVGEAPGGFGDAAWRAEAGYRDVGERLRRRIWDPVAARIGRAALVLIVPDGALNLVSFAALPAGDASYLVETAPPVHYLSAERDVVRPSGPVAEQGVLALGGPDFELAASAPSAAAWRTSAPSCAEFASRTFEPLPRAAREAEEVAGLFVDEPTRVLTGKAAQEGAFKRDAAGNRMLHVATHGFFLQELCPSLLGVAAQLDPGDAALPLALAADSPLVLSGLVLAGANRRGAAGSESEDGLLTAEEVAGLDLTGVEWAVLSACDTGLGTVRAGEGVLGLRRAFQVAGARTVILSLWRVGDEASRRWMLALYTERLSGRSTAEAVRRASSSALTARRRAGRSTHPAHWGAFVATGDWR